jgi:hypothetical protein
MNSIAFKPSSQFWKQEAFLIGGCAIDSRRWWRVSNPMLANLRRAEIPSFGYEWRADLVANLEALWKGHAKLATMPDVETIWTEAYGAVPPAADRLRSAGDVGWLRAHTLPGSKRYADTEMEAAEVFRRVSAVGDAVLGLDARCHLIQMEAEGEIQAGVYRAVRQEFGLTPAWRFDDSQDGGPLWSISTAEVQWSGKKFAPLLRKIAADEIAGLIWLGEDGSVFAPYDGGVDIFMRPAGRAGEMKGRFANWLSPRSDGL